MTTNCNYPLNEIAIKNFRNGKLEEFWPCCMMANRTSVQPRKNILGITNSHTLTPQEMFDHPRMKTLRENLDNGIKDSACAICWQQEDRGLKSFRQFSLEKIQNNSTELNTLDLSASNLCNLQCRMCQPVCSNLLMKDYQYFKNNNLLGELNSVTNKFQPSVAYGLDETIQMKWIRENTNQITKLRISGGEPLYDSKIIDLLKLYIKNDHAKNTELWFHTNATLFSREIIDILKQFKLNKHVFSVDGINRVYEYVRHPATFNQLTESINLYIETMEHADRILNFNFVVSSLNLLNAADFIEWSSSLTTSEYETCAFFSEVSDPDRGISIKHLPIHLLKESKDRILLLSLNDPNVDNLVKQIDIAIENNKENKEKMLKEITLFDLSRNQSYENYLDAELVRWLNGN
jgi:organic radical activating enzyme